MFSNHRKTIGAFIERSIGEFQNLLCQGIIETAKQKGYNVATFSSYGNYGKNDRYFVGDKMLFELPDYENLDGVILALDTMGENESREIILEKVRTKCHCPVVSIREIAEGANNLLVENTTCLDSIIEHFVKVHGFTKIACMTGPESHWDARERLTCFRNAMARYGLPVGEHQVFYGDFWKNKGKEACDWFLEADERPEAIICANDYMALAVMNELLRRGMHIPEDICVSGYDGLIDTITFTPSVTTVEVPFLEMGKKAVELIDEKQDTPDDIQDIFFPTKVIARETCGCLWNDGDDVVNIRRKQYEEVQIESNRNMQFNFFSTHLGECNTLEKISDKLRYFIYDVDGIKNYALCFCENFEERKDHDGFTDTMEVRIEMRDESALDMRIPFSRKELLPKELTDETPQIWYFTSLHHQDECYGYEAYTFNDQVATGQLHFTWSVILGNKIKEMLIEYRMQKMIKKLESLYNRDELTGLYNRRGIEIYGRDMFEKAKEEGRVIFLAVIDMDGMKQINDNYGHNEGDFALKKLCEAITKSCGQSVCARTGGDEFLVMAEGISEEEGLGWMQEMDKKLQEFNHLGKKVYKIHASYGYACHVPRSKDTVESFVKESDEAMYKNKMINKIQRGEQLR